MAITDATTSLSTAWTEYSTVSFKAGTLADQDACVTEVESKLNRGTLSATTKPTTTEVKRWLQRYKQEIASTKGYSWKRRYVYCSTAASQSRYSLPPDFDGGYLAVKDITNNRYIVLVNEHLFDSTYPDRNEESNNEPSIGVIKGRELWLIPPPAGVYTLELEYDRSGDDQTATDFSWLPEIERFRCCDGAIAESFESLHNWEAADRFKMKYMGGVIGSQKAEGRRKWRNITRCYSYFEEAAGRSNQP